MKGLGKMEKEEVRKVLEYMMHSLDDSEDNTVQREEFDTVKMELDTLKYNSKAFWDVEEICGYLKICRKTFYNKVKGNFPMMRVGKKKVARAADVMRYADQLFNVSVGV